MSSFTEEEIQGYIAKRALYLADHTPTSVYRYFDANSHLLYVGVTERGFKRTGEHSKMQEWWSQVSLATFEHFPNRAAALEAEARAITYEAPLYNHVIPDVSDPVRLREDTARALWRVAEKEVRRELRDIDLRVNGSRHKPYGTSVQRLYDDVVERLEQRQRR